MQTSGKKKHYGLKIILILAVLFFGFMAVTDFNPKVTHVEKTETYTER